MPKSVPPRATTSPRPGATPPHPPSVYGQLAVVLGAAHHQSIHAGDQGARLALVDQRVQQLWWWTVRASGGERAVAGLQGMPAVVEPDLRAPAGLDVVAVLDRIAAGFAPVAAPGPYPPPSGEFRTGPPGPVCALSVLLYVIAGLTVVLALLFAALGAAATWVAGFPLLDLVGGPTLGHVQLASYAGAAFLVLCAAVDIALGVGLWRGRRWAWLLTTGFAVLNVPLSFAASFPPLIVLNLLVAVVLLVLLTAPRSTRDHFGRRGPHG